MRAVFFDRDGVINIDREYVYRKQDFIFYDDFFSIAKYFKDRKFKLIVITNQSGIERGFYNVLDFLAICKFMQEEIYKKLHFYMDAIYFCKNLSSNDFFRKPNNGMILQASKRFNINLENSFLVGDKISDIEAGIKSNIKNLFLINRNANISANDNDFKDTLHHKNVEFKHIKSLLQMRDEV